MHNLPLLAFAGLILMSSSLPSQAASAVQIDYGVVDSVGTTTKDSKHAGGALAGGIIGGLIGPDLPFILLNRLAAKQSAFVKPPVVLR
jgi:hypothetical protein